jgi:hypothetical protein
MGMGHLSTKTPRSFFSLIRLFLKKNGFLIAGILLFLPLGALAIGVPLGDANPIGGTNPEAAYLPPKLWDSSKGFWDGTGEVKGALLDPASLLPARNPSTGDFDYSPEAVLGSVRSYEKKVNELTPEVKAYGQGGAVTLRNGGGGQEGGIHPSAHLFDSLEERTYSLSFDQSASQGIGGSPEWRLLLKADFSGTGVCSDAIPLTSFSKNYETLTLDSTTLFTLLHSSMAFLSSGKTSFMAYPEIQLSSGMESQVLYVSSFIDSLDPLSSWEDATKMLAGAQAWVAEGNAQEGLYGSTLVYGDFRYDYYRGAFGTEEDGFKEAVFSESEVEDFLARGYLRYTWQRKTTNEIPSFEILDDVHCPLREVKKEILDNGHSSLLGLKSPYRYHYYRGWIGKCEPPRFAFGTDRTGTDFAKSVFLGLGFSLSFVLATLLLCGFGCFFLGLISVYFEGSANLKLRNAFEITSALLWGSTAALLLYRSRSWEGVVSFIFLLSLWLSLFFFFHPRVHRRKIPQALDPEGKEMPFRFFDLFPNQDGSFYPWGVFLFPGSLLFELILGLLPEGALGKSAGVASVLQLAISQGEEAAYLLLSSFGVWGFAFLSLALIAVGVIKRFFVFSKNA